MNQNERKTVARRMILLIAVACVIMGLYVMRLIFLQLVNGDDFKAKATNTTDYNFTVTAARGDIVDNHQLQCGPQQTADGRPGSGHHAAADRGAAACEWRELE